MTFRQRLACNISPLMLRLVLGLTFVWAGLGKVIERDVQVTPANAQQLVEWGAVAQSEVDPMLAPGADITVQGPKVPRLYSLAFLLKSASAPGDFEPGHARAGEKKMALVPEFAASGKTPVYLAWAAALTEVFAGGFLLLGFVARLSAVALAGVMLSAMWLTEIGPAIQNGTTVWGFLPDRAPFDIGAWKSLGWQVALLGCSIATLFAGAGALSLDRLLFGGGGGDAPAPKKPQG